MISQNICLLAYILLFRQPWKEGKEEKKQKERRKDRRKEEGRKEEGRKEEKINILNRFSYY